MKDAQWAKDNGRAFSIAVPNDVGPLKKTVDTAIKKVEEELNIAIGACSGGASPEAGGEIARGAKFSPGS